MSHLPAPPLSFTSSSSFPPSPPPPPPATDSLDAAESTPVHTSPQTAAAAMDASGDEMEEKDSELRGRSRPHSQRKRRREHVQQQCSTDGCTHRLTHKERHTIDGVHVCGSCWQAHRKSLPASAVSHSLPSADSSASALSPLLAPRDHSVLSAERRWAIINYKKLGMTAETIARTVGCSTNTVYHWINVHRATGGIDDSPRSGRPRIITPDFAASARAHPFAATPRMLKAEHATAVNKRTIRRRLNDDSLFGRVARRFLELSPSVVRDRLSFADGYRDWNEDKWMTVLFSDEKIFTLGWHGRVWVQRPKNTEWKPEYCIDQQNHPPGVNFWCCFSGGGVGGSESFTYKNTGVVMRGILQYHLINSARKFFCQRPPEQWWLLWDNSPIHKSAAVQNWLHCNGVSCLDLPAYSPDLNPTEHLFADLARRVEQRFPRTVDELQDAIHDEWAKTDHTFLRHLASSMRKRIQAVIDNQGHSTKY
jgi:transposase